jgi:Protein of unknown function (DUF3179)
VLIRTSTPGRRAFWRLAGIAVGAWAVTILGVFGYEALTLRVSRDDVGFNTDPANPFQPFRMPGIVRPPIVEAGASGLRPDEEVIGIEVDGHPRAYRLSAFRDRSHHVVNDMIDGVPVTVSYCDISDCVRTYTDPGKSAPLEVAVAGLFEGGEMVLDVDGHLYLQKTGKPLKPGEGPSSLPLEQLSPTRTTWERWRREHPSTGVYRGDR